MRNRLKGKVLTVNVWWENGLYETPKGYSPPDGEKMHSFRVGSFCIAWEVLEES